MVTFQQADQRYLDLRRRYDAGLITDAHFEEELKELMVQDEAGRWWAKSRETGTWHYFDGSTWIQDVPPGYARTVVAGSGRSAESRAGAQWASGPARGVASGTVVDRPVVEDRVIDRPGEFQVQHTERANYGKASREQEQIDARPPARGWSLGPILLVVLATTFAIQALITAPLILHAMSDRDGQFLYNLQNAPIIGPFVLYWGILGPLNALAPDWGVGMSLSEAMRVVFFVALGHLLLAAGCFRLAYRAAHRPS